MTVPKFDTQGTTSSPSITYSNIIIRTFVLHVAISCLFKETVADNSRDGYHENLFIRPLIDGKLLAQFEFTTIYRSDIKSLKWEDKFELFPISMADLIALTDVEEIHFSLTKGNWNYRNWGYITSVRPPGALIRVKPSDHNQNTKKSWKRLINSLAGKFCSSLEAANDEILVRSQLVFNGLNSTNNFLYANLPEETLCTENLTPWRKLLPCYLNSGLASLLNAVNLFKSSYSSLAIDLNPTTCEDCSGLDTERVQLTQRINIVFNPLNLFEGKQMWSLSKIFGNAIQKTCPVAYKSQIAVDVTDLNDKSKLYPQSYKEQKLDIELGNGVVDHRTIALFDLDTLLSNSTTALNIGVKQNQIFKQPPFSSRPTTPIQLKTHIAGLGSGDGTVVATITNRLNEPVQITYMDVLPHFMRVYLHTLTIRTPYGQELKPDKFNFELSHQTYPTLIEFSIMIPAATETQISYDFDRAFLRWTDYKPDANKGVLLGSALINIPSKHLRKNLIVSSSSIESNSSKQQFISGKTNETLEIYARPLLIILPTPDFSMPYNVICLVCTVLVIAFGPLHNFTTRKPVIKASKETLGKQAIEESKKND